MTRQSHVLIHVYDPCKLCWPIFCVLTVMKTLQSLQTYFLCSDSNIRSYNGLRTLCLRIDSIEVLTVI